MNIRTILRKGDFVLFFLFVLIAAAAAFLPWMHSTAPAGRVRITCSGQEYGIYPLDEDQEIEILQNGHTNIVSIRGGQVLMKHSDCRNQVCVDTGAVSRTGQTIVCLPNRVVVEILGDGKGGASDEESIDAVVK